MARTRIKVCGNTQLENALMAVSCGADALGFIFVTKSKRNVKPDVAADIISNLPPFVSRVGVFVNESLENILDIAKKCSLTHLQLHGDESPAFCQTVKDLAPELEIIKAFRVDDNSTREDFVEYYPYITACLLDTYCKGEHGGTGKTFDWHIVEKLDLKKPLILAGGLEPENVTDAIRSTGAYCLDVNSGVESAPGIKDKTKLDLLIKNVAKYDLENLMI